MYPVSTPMPNFSGHCIGQGRLLLLEELGSGGFGTVYRALDTKSVLLPEYIYYAVKVLNRPADDTEPARNNLEFTLHRSVCDHPNILPVHDVICDDLFYYVIFELCPEGDLHAAITKRNIYQQNDDLVKSVFVQLIDAVHYCHENGIFHRDIKAENILCSADGTNLYLSDFGLATEDKISDQFGCGSVCYMSPECIGKETRWKRFCTRANDVWSLGVVFVLMITGQYPWLNATVQDKHFRMYLEDYSYLLEKLPISETANWIINRMLDIDPKCRITLPELRDEILNADSFFASSYESWKPTPDSPPLADYCDIQVPAQLSTMPDSDDDDNDDTPSASPNCSILNSYHSEEHPIAGKTLSSNERAWSADAIFCTLDSAGSDSASDESGFPITPETTAAELDVEVSVLSEGKDLHELVGRFVELFPKPPPLVFAENYSPIIIYQP